MSSQIFFEQFQTVTAALSYPLITFGGRQQATGSTGDWPKWAGVVDPHHVWADQAVLLKF